MWTGVTMVLIQTSAAINFGNSGGALINQYGQVVGITTIKIVTDDGSAEALGFAIPSRRVKYVVDALIAGEEIRTGVFGFTVSTRPLEGGGLEMISGGPQASDAAAKGLQAGDIILAANGQTVTTTQDLARLKLSMGPGDVITLTIRRGRRPSPWRWPWWMNPSLTKEGGWDDQHHSVLHPAGRGLSDAPPD